MKLRHLPPSGAVVLTATVLVLLASSGQAQAEGATTTKFPVGIESFSTCTNEQVLLTGTFNVVTHSFTNATGFHQHFQLSLSEGKGVGETTGISYIMTQTVQAFDYAGEVPALISEVVGTNLIGQGSAPNQVVKFQLHITVDAQGNVTAFIDSASTTCEGG
jgi:hypothetical protein